jgi:hypothetical protein
MVSEIGHLGRGFSLLLKSAPPPKPPTLEAVSAGNCEQPEVGDLTVYQPRDFPLWIFLHHAAMITHLHLFVTEIRISAKTRHTELTLL